MRAGDLMTTDVDTVPPATPVRAIARLLASRHISSVPVLDAEGQVLGIVTEADVLRRLAGAAEKPRGWFGSLFASAASDAEHYTRTHGVKASDVMTTKLVSVAEDATAESIALLMEERHVKRVLVLRNGMLAGVVSRADLLAALLAPAAEPAAGAEDERIRKAIESALHLQPWSRPFFIWPTVEGGVVTFHGFCDVEEVRHALRVMAEDAAGVTGVKLDISNFPRALYGA